MNRSSRSLRDLFEAALALAPPARAAFLDEHCPLAHERARVETLLAADADADEPLSGDALERLALAIGDGDAPLPLPPGSRIGPFEVVEVLGEGGSSTVFHATREIEGAIQHVALKLLRRSLHSPEAQRLFRREQRALIQLRHPNIARMIEGGVTETGLPYIALELVNGTSITEHARARQLDLRRRLRLFVVVCAAVDAAHRALIVHRDLKPSNVLVTDEGEVKLLDFGVAKLLAEEDGDGNRTMLPAFTPAYAAPEQRDGGTITTATDVYALGVLLGELLTGERVNDGSGRTPSSRIGRTMPPGASPAPVPASRRQLRGDLDAIVMKAIDTQAMARYASAGALADDIERLLSDRPVSAHMPSRWYRTRKFVVRHKGAVGSTLAFLVAVLCALGIAVWQAQLAREQARIARSESSRANAIRDFVVDLLKTASAELPKDQRPTPEALVAQAAKEAREDRDLDPVVRAQLLLTLGEIARANGDYANAESLIDEAIERERELGVATASPEWIGAVVAKGNILHSTNRSDEADRLMQGLLPVLDSSDSEASVSALMLYGVTRAYAGDAAQAVAVAEKALAKAQRVFGADSDDGIETATYLGQLLTSLRRYRESSAILEEATQRWRRLQLPMNEQFARSLFQLAVSKRHLGERAAVEPLFHEGITLMHSIHKGPFHRLAQGLTGYAAFLIESERYDEAQAAIEEALAIDRALFGPEHVRVATTLELLGILGSARHEHAMSEAHTRDALDILQRHARKAGYELELARARLRHASTLHALGRLDEAGTVLVQAQVELPLHFGAHSAEVADAMRVGGGIALDRGDASAALAQAERALALLHGLDLPVTAGEIEAHVLRANALLELRRLPEAHLEAARALDRQRATVPEAHARLAGLLALRARIERGLGDDAAATATIAEARALAVPMHRLAAGDRATLR